MTSSSKDLVLAYFGYTHAPHNGGPKNWNTWWNYYTLMVRWVAALAWLSNTTIDDAAARIHTEPLRYQERGVQTPYQMDGFKKSGNGSRMPGVMGQAWIVSGETGHAVRKGNLEMLAMGCNIQVT